ncbi:MAG: D-sedoheptulose-7-phosphate isomerase [Actinomycetota bacterium]
MNADAIHVYLSDSARTLDALADGCAEDVAKAASLIADAIRAGGKLLICGNGGSAADAQGLATEFVSTLTTDRRRPAIPAIALTTDTSILTAIANDFGFDGVFARQVEAIARPGDVLLGISTSGNSRDVLLAVDEARGRGLATIALTGATGGKLVGSVDVAIRVPSDATSHIQEAHLAVEHALAFAVENDLYPLD